MGPPGGVTFGAWEASLPCSQYAWRSRNVSSEVGRGADEARGGRGQEQGLGTVVEVLLGWGPQTCWSGVCTDSSHLPGPVNPPSQPHFLGCEMGEDLSPEVKGIRDPCAPRLPGATWPWRRRGWRASPPGSLVGEGPRLSGPAPRPPGPRTQSPAHLSDLPEAVPRHVGEDVAVGLGQDLKGHGAVVVLQGRDIVVADGQLRAGVDLVPGVGGQGRGSLGILPGGGEAGGVVPAAAEVTGLAGVTALCLCVRGTHSPGPAARLPETLRCHNKPQLPPASLLKVVRPRQGPASLQCAGHGRGQGAFSGRMLWRWPWRARCAGILPGRFSGVLGVITHTIQFNTQMHKFDRTAGVLL